MGDEKKPSAPPPPPPRAQGGTSEGTPRSREAIQPIANRRALVEKRKLTHLDAGSAKPACGPSS